MPRNKHAALKIDDTLLKRARQAMKSSSDVETVRCALEEAIANRQTATALRRLLRQGRGRFADLGPAAGVGSAGPLPVGSLPAAKSDRC